MTQPTGMAAIVAEPLASELSVKFPLVSSCALLLKVSTPVPDNKKLPKTIFSEIPLVKATLVKVHGYCVAIFSPPAELKVTKAVPKLQVPELMNEPPITIGLVPQLSVEPVPVVRSAPITKALLL